MSEDGIACSMKLINIARTGTPTESDAGAALVGAIILYACDSPNPMTVLDDMIHALELSAIKLSGALRSGVAAKRTGPSS